MAYEINYDDQRFKDVETDKKNAIAEIDKTYGDMIDKSGDFYQEQVDATKDWEKKQTELQNQQTEFAIKEINQKKDQAKKDYTKEQSGAYVDWQKQSNEFGAEAEKMAAQGMANTGFAESSQVAMYNNYQTRVVAARESFSRIVQDFDNDITQARLQNNAALAEIAFNSLQKRLELNLQGFQYKNQLLLEQANRKTETEQIFHERWQDVLDQMNTENALAEEMRQFNEQMAFEREQWDWQVAQAAAKSSGGGGGGGGSSRKSSSGSSGSSGGSASIKKSSGSSSKGGDLPKDTASSILGLGQGPISATNLAKQVNSGKVTATKSPTTGNTLFAKASPTSSLKYSKYRF